MIFDTQIGTTTQPQPIHASIGGDATAMMMAAAKLATTATGPATTNKVDDVIDDINKKKQSIRSEADEQLNVGAAARKTGIKSAKHFSFSILCFIIPKSFVNNVASIHR